MYFAKNKEELARYLGAHGWDGSEEVWQFEDGAYFLASQPGDIPIGASSARFVGVLRNAATGQLFFCPICFSEMEQGVCAACGAPAVA